MATQTLNIIKIFSLTGLSFFIGLIWTPVLTHFLYKFKLWKKKPQTEKHLDNLGVSRQEQSQETNTPRMGGILIWLTVLILCLLSGVFKSAWLPLLALILGSLVGLLDDFWVVQDSTKERISFKWRLITILLIGFLVGYLFYFKGWPVYYIALVPLVMIIIFGGAPIDGLDGLAGGVMIPIWAVYTTIAFAQGQIDLAIFCGLVVGALLAFVYFNIPPARFYLGETGMIGLITALVTVAFLTHTVWVLPLIALPLIATAGSILLQIFWVQVLRRKLFHITPLHHHFEALGWSSQKVVMRYWIFSAGFATIGLVVALLSF